MPFATDTAWPAGLLRIFEICRNKPHKLESRYYGPYTTLLAYCFGSNSYEFFIAPQNPPNDRSAHEAVDSIVFLVVFDKQGHPVLIAEIKDDACADTGSLRFKADEQMRHQFDFMLDDCPLPRLWGLSLLGTSLRVYCGEVITHFVDPVLEGLPDHTFSIPPDTLEGAWDVDILSQEGFAKMKEIVGDIVENAAAL